MFLICGNGCGRSQHSACAEQWQFPEGGDAGGEAAFCFPCLAALRKQVEIQDASLTSTVLNTYDEHCKDMDKPTKKEVYDAIHENVVERIKNLPNHPSHCWDGFWSMPTLVMRAMLAIQVGEGLGGYEDPLRQQLLRANNWLDLRVKLDGLEKVELFLRGSLGPLINLGLDPELCYMLLPMLRGSVIAVFLQVIKGASTSPGSKVQPPCGIVWDWV
jgi:hypothetical protein